MLKKLEEVAEIKTVKKTDSKDCLWIVNAGNIKLLKSAGKYKAEHLFKIVPGTLIDLDYLFHVLSRPLENVIKDINSALPKITIKQLKEIEIPVLSIEQQKKVIKSKNLHRRLNDLWREYGIKAYEEPLKINMSFEDALKFIMQKKKS
ncbi:MAG TPA: hypothetical protein VNW06_10745 [Cytophagaceae bacterium]|jgi:restriction endonuclease S subunit|nr:hypothetical protein [Cytophagaceae bacterium]